MHASDESDIDAVLSNVDRDYVDAETEDEEELAVSLENAVLLNNAYSEILCEFADFLRAKLRDNESRREELKNSSVAQAVSNSTSGSGHPNSLIVFMAPYFKDVKGISAPVNEDVLGKRRKGEINQAYLYPSKPWNKSEKAQLKEIVLNAFKDKQVEEFRKEKEKITRDQTSLKKPEKLSKIKKLDKEMDEIVKKPLSYFMPPRNDKSIDWLRVAAQLDTPHTDYECEILWNNLLHPAVSDKQWTKEEDESLRKLVDEFGRNDWDTVAEELGTNRVAWQCCSRYQQKLNNEMRRSGPLSKAEAELVEKMIATCRVGDYIPWHQVGYFIEGRSLAQIKHYWQKINVPKRGNVWNELEDRVLMAAVKKYGIHDWRKVSFYIPGRSNRQCRERYMMRLNFNDRKLGNWTAEEDQLILKLAKEHNFRWAKIEKLMEGRNARQIASRYDLLSKNVKEDEKSKNKKMTRTIKIQSKLYDRIKTLSNRGDKNDSIEKFLRDNRKKLQEQLELGLSGVVTTKGRPKKLKTENNIDDKIVDLFYYFGESSSNVPKKQSTDRSFEDQLVYDYTIDSIFRLLKGKEIANSNNLAVAVKEVFHRNIVGKLDFSKNIPFLPPNRTTVQGLLKLLLQREYLMSKVISSGITPEEIEKFQPPDIKEYKELSDRFKSLFFWPALLTTIDPPSRKQLEDVKPNVDKLKLKIAKSWLSTCSTRMIEIRSQTKQLIENAIQNPIDVSDEESESEIPETSSKTPWYLQPRERRYYKPKSLDKNSFIFTRIRPIHKQVTNPVVDAGEDGTNKVESTEPTVASGSSYSKAGPKKSSQTRKRKPSVEPSTSKRLKRSSTSKKICDNSDNSSDVDKDTDIEVVQERRRSLRVKKPAEG